MNQNEIEKDLRQFASDWKNQPGIADNVVDRLEADSINELTENAETQTLETIGGAAVCETSKASAFRGSVWLPSTLTLFLAAIVGLVVTFGLRNSTVGEGFVSAEMLQEANAKAIKTVETARLTVTHFDENTGGENGNSLNLFDRQRGLAFGSMVDGQWVLESLENGKFSWALHSGSQVKPKIYLKNKSDIKFENIFLDFAAELESDYERAKGEDVTVDGKKCACFSSKNIAPFVDGAQRYWIFVDDQNLVQLTRTWKFNNERWHLLSETKFEYNVEIDPARFEPRFDEKTKVVDMEKEFDKVASLDNCLFSKQIESKTYAIHRVTPVEGAGLAVLASLRLTDRDSSGVGWNGSNTIKTDDYYRLVNGTAGFVQWYLLLPRDPTTKVNPFISGNKVSFPEDLLIFENDSTCRHEVVEATFDLPKVPEPVSLEDAAKLVYQEQQKLEYCEFKILNTGIKVQDGVPHQHTGSVETTSLEEYQQSVVDHLAYYRRLDIESETNRMESQMLRNVQKWVPGINMYDFKAFGDDELKRVCKKRPNLEVVRISGTSVTDDSLKFLLPLERLEELVMCRTAITDKSVETLIQLESLKTLDIRGTTVTPAGVTRLKAGLPNTDVESGPVTW